MSRTACLDGKMSTATVRRATAQDAEVLGIIGPAPYAEAYGYLWDRPDAYSDQLRTFGAPAFASLLAQPDARLWIGEVGGAAVGFLSMIVGPVGLRYPESTLLGQPSAWAWAACYSTQRLNRRGPWACFAFGST